MSQVVSRFYDHNPDRHVVNMTIDDVDHIGEDEKRAILSSYPSHEVEARTKGVPQLGSGRIYPVAQSAIEVESFDIPKHWPRISGHDFGWTHPSATVWLAWDRDGDVVYVTGYEKASERTAEQNGLSIANRGKWIPCAWPADGLQHDKGSGEQLASQYRKAGANMLWQHAVHPDSLQARSSTSVEAGIQEILGRMQSGRFKVFQHLNDWWKEFLIYHRQEGKIHKENDDLMDATRYAIMMLRHSVVEKSIGGRYRYSKYRVRRGRGMVK